VLNADRSTATTNSSVERTLANDLDGKSSSCSSYEAFASKPKCVLWHNYSVAGPSNPNWGYQVHLPLWGNGAIVGWNIKIWREGDSEPIFQRDVCDPNAGKGGYPYPKGHNTDPSTSPSWNNEWWDCSGAYSQDSSSRAGMIGDPNGNENLQPTCSTDNVRNSNNGKRNEYGEVGGSGPPIPDGGVRPTLGSLPSGTWCYFEGSQIGDNQEFYGKRTLNGHSLPKDQFGSGSSGSTTAGLEEGIFLQWTLGVDRKSLVFHYAIQGEPGKYYAVQIVALNWKQQMMPIFSGSPYAVEAGGPGGSPQYFRVFVANPTTKCTSTISCTGGETPAAEATPSVLLATNSPLQTREEGHQNITLSILEDPLNAGQAIFPIEDYLEHYSPQGAYDGSQTGCAASYSPEYVLYDSDISPPWRFQATGGGPPGACQAGLPQTAALTDDSRAIGTLSSNPYETTWLEPTLDNPCTIPLKTDSLYATGSWPKSLSYCTTTGKAPVAGASTPSTSGGKYTVRNAWDDEMMAQATWESRWVSSVGSSPSYGEITGQLLRCNSSSRIGQILRGNECPSPYYGLPAYTKGHETQDAQGYIYATSNKNNATLQKKRGTEQAQVEVKLYTNAPISHGGSGDGEEALWDRTTGQVMGNPNYTSSEAGAEDSNTHQPITNTRTGLNELNFCDQGINQGTRIYQSATQPNLDIAASSSKNIESAASADNYPATSTGDSECQGYAVHWVWSDPQSLTNPDCNVQFASEPTGDTGAPKVTSFPAPTAYALDPTTHQPDTTATSIVTSWGLYGDEQPGSQMAYKTASWKADRTIEEAMGVGAKMPPYTGSRPGIYKVGAATTGSTEHCSQIYPLPATGQVAHWKDGHWERHWTFTAVTPDSQQTPYSASSCPLGAGPYYSSPSPFYTCTSRPGGVTVTKYDFGGECRFKVTEDLTTGQTLKDDLSGPESQQPAGAPAGSSQGCAPSPITYYPKITPLTVNPLTSPTPGQSSAYTAPSWIAYGVSVHHKLPYTCPGTSVSGDKFVTACTATYEGTGKERKQTGYDVTSYYYNSTYQDSYYSFGYWHWTYTWVWGSATAGKAPNPYTCETSITSLSQTNVTTHPKAYAGPLDSPTATGYDETKFVYGYGGYSPDPSQPANEDTQYNAQSDATYLGASVSSGSVWQGTQYSDDGGTYGSVGTSGASSWQCVVIRHGGWDTNGAWTTGVNDSHEEETPATTSIYGQEFATVLAGPGWGDNNTGPRLPNGEYNVQFAFDHLSTESLTRPTSSYCSGIPRGEVLPTSYALCWAMYGTYEGRTDFTWSHATRFNKQKSLADPAWDEASSLIYVYGPRNTR
jgi:hypothetical protein